MKTPLVADSGNVHSGREIFDQAAAGFRWIEPQK
jgi:hypothetical protein